MPGSESGAPSERPPSRDSGRSLYFDAAQSHHETESDAGTQPPRPSSAVSAATATTAATAVTAATSPAITAPDDVWEDSEPVPGSKTKKLIFHSAPFEWGEWSREQWQDRFLFVAGQLEALVYRYLRLVELTNRPVYDPRMVGTSRAKARPAIVVTCRHADFKNIRNLFDEKAEGPLCLGKVPATSRLRSRFGLRAERPASTIPRLQLVYYRTSSAPIIRNALSKPLSVSLGAGSIACGALIRYGERSATLGVALEVGGKIGILTVDHLFPSGEVHHREVHQESSSAFAGSSDDRPDSPSSSSDLDGSPEYDDEYEDLICPDYDTTADATEVSGAEKVGEEPAQWEWKLLANSGDPASSAEAYLDWALTCPESTATEASAIIHLNTVFPTGNGREGVVLREIQPAPSSHLAPVYMVSGIRGVLGGRILRAPSLLGSCQAWTVILDEPKGRILSGESGSVVVDRATNKVYGHVVGSGSQGHAYVVPLAHVLRQLRDHFYPDAIAHELASPDGLRASPEKTAPASPTTRAPSVALPLGGQRLASASQRETVESTKVGPNRRPTAQSPTLDGVFSDDSDIPRLPPAFALVLLNPAAQKAVDHVRNAALVCRVDSGTSGFPLNFSNPEKGTNGLWLDFSNPEKQWYTLGCGDTDIYLPDARSSKNSAHIFPFHAAFQIVEETGAVLLWDHSERGTVEPLPHHHVTVNFRLNTQSVLVARGVNERIAFGRDQWYQFEIHWRSDGLYRFPKGEPYSLGPRNARSKSYLYGGEIGAGSYGTVLWALDTTNGRIIAVKKFHNLSGKNLEFATREIANLFRIDRDKSIKHDHILQILGCAGGMKGNDWGEIFMPLMQGNLRTLVEQGGVQGKHDLSDVVLWQMLLALECVASHHIIHRDIKPENILWDYDETGNYRFCLGDFGLSSDPGLARTAAGTEPFMAPEVFYGKPQNMMVDIWSLFAVIVWTRVDQFRRSCSQLRAPEIHTWLIDTSKLKEYTNIQGMASMDPRQRPSATRQLEILDADFDGWAGIDGEAELDDVRLNDLRSRFSRDLSLQKSGISKGGISPDLPEYPEPYQSGIIKEYEPYVSRIMEEYLGERGGPSRRYISSSLDLADSPRESWVMPYESANAYTESLGSGTAVPDNRTVPITMDVGDEADLDTEEVSRRRKKGKSRAEAAQPPSWISGF